MADKTDDTEEQDIWPCLRVVFHKVFTQNGGESAMAFIATLDELDARMGVSDAQIAQNSETFETLVKWFNLTSDRLRNIPGQIKDSTAAATARLSADIALEVSKGARNGAAASYAALEALREAIEGYEARKRHMTHLALLGLPVAFSATLFAAFLFASFVIPALPQDWQWPCKLIGAEFRPNINPDQTISFCVIVRD
jgi:hypothetical protein